MRTAVYLTLGPVEEYVGAPHVDTSGELTVSDGRGVHAVYAHGTWQRLEVWPDELTYKDVYPHGQGFYERPALASADAEYPMPEPDPATLAP